MKKILLMGLISLNMAFAETSGLADALKKIANEVNAKDSIKIETERVFIRDLNAFSNGKEYFVTAKIHSPTATQSLNKEDIKCFVHIEAIQKEENEKNMENIEKFRSIKSVSLNDIKECYISLDYRNGEK